MRNKDPSLLKLLQRIENSIGREDYQIVDHWTGDLLATGLAKLDDPRTLIYISTNSEHEDRYFFECESPQEEGTDSDYEVARRGQDCSLSELIHAIKEHLDLS